MPALHSRPACWIAAGLAILMVATRFHHQGSSLALPDASLAVFFLAGWYLRSPIALAGLLAGAFAIDYIAIAYLGVSGYCVSPAYGFLIPAYAALWSAGRWAAPWHRQEDRFVIRRCILALSASTAAAFLVTEISFFLFSGRETGLAWTVYGSGMLEHFPGYLAATFLYCGLAFSLHSLLRPRSATTSAPVGPG